VQDRRIEMFEMQIGVVLELADALPSRTSMVIARETMSRGASLSRSARNAP